MEGARNRGTLLQFGREIKREKGGGGAFKISFYDYRGNMGIDGLLGTTGLEPAASAVTGQLRDVTD